MRKHKSSLAALILVLVLALLVTTGCGTSEEGAGSGKEYEIVTVVKITGIPWFNRLEEGVVQAAEDFGVNAYQQGPADADPAQQATPDWPRSENSVIGNSTPWVL